MFVMQLNALHPPLVWLETGQTFPPVHQAWGKSSPAPGLLCAGSDLSVQTLLDAYGNGIFPWFSEGQPILWWSPDPRMVLSVDAFCLHHSLKKTLRKFAIDKRCDIRIDSAFAKVIRNCAESARNGPVGTWIVPDMIRAYTDLHHAGYAHSVETWFDGELVGGLYFVCIGAAVFGESMFHWRTDASKIALAALVCLCRHNAVDHIDCQQKTPHLTSLGAREIPRQHFVEAFKARHPENPIHWHFSKGMWNELIPDCG